MSRSSPPLPPASRKRASGTIARSRASVPNNLPLTLGRFVGRGHDIDRVTALLTEARLVTLTGSPGVGKTRLSVEVARGAGASFPKGTWLVQLAPLAQPELVARATASVLGVRERSAEGDVDDYAGLIGRIGNDTMLLVLDNCEHLLDASAQMTAGLLEACPNLAILATSQERLGVLGERVWPVPGLGLPATRLEGAGGEEPPGPEAASAHAVQLFVERAQEATPGFVLNSHNLDPVVEICRRLDGIPLAIELAAARVQMFSVGDIARHLDDRFTFLTGGSRAALPRHQTLKAAVDWSYDLLIETEQTLLRRLSVFAGGASLDAIEQVCTGDAVEADGCLEVITRLVSRSLVVADTARPEARYHLLETIRFYGKDRQVSSGEVTATAARHLRWCVELAEAAEPHLTGPDQREWLSRLGAEHDNLRAAMAWSLDQGPTDQALRLAGALAMFWRAEGHFREGFDWLDRILAVSEDADPRLRAKALWGHALMSAMLGLYTVTNETGRAALALYRELGDPKGEGRALLLLGTVRFTAQSTSVSTSIFQRSIALARQADDQWCMALSLARCGSTLAQLGDSVSAQSVLEQSIAVARAAGDAQSLRFGLVSLGQLALVVGNHQGARIHFEQALATDATSANTYELAVAQTGLAKALHAGGERDRAHGVLAEAMDACRVSGDATIDVTIAMGRLALAEGDLDAAEGRFTVAQKEAGDLGCTSPSALLGLGEIAMARGDVATARPLVTKVLELSEATQDRQVVASAMFAAADLAGLAGDVARATNVHARVLTDRYEIGDLAGVAASLEALAQLAATTGSAERSARLFGAADALRQSCDLTRPVLARAGCAAACDTSREDLGAKLFDSAYGVGETMALESAVLYASRGRGTRGKRPATGPAALTNAEREIARLAIQGLTNPEIGRRLFVSLSTVKTHMGRVFAKLSISSRTELISRFSNEGF